MNLKFYCSLLVFSSFITIVCESALDWKHQKFEWTFSEAIFCIILLVNVFGKDIFLCVIVHYDR